MCRAYFQSPLCYIHKIFRSCLVSIHGRPDKLPYPLLVQYFQTWVVLDVVYSFFSVNWYKYGFIFHFHQLRLILAQFMPVRKTCPIKRHTILVPSYCLTAGANLYQYQYKAPDNIQKTTRELLTTFIVDHHFGPVPISLLSREGWFPSNATLRICFDHIQLCAVAVCKLLSQTKVTNLPTNIQPLISENIVHLKISFKFANEIKGQDKSGPELIGILTNVFYNEYTGYSLNRWCLFVQKNTVWRTYTHTRTRGQTDCRHLLHPKAKTGPG